MRFAFQKDASIFQGDDAVCELCDPFHFVFHHDHRHAAFRHLADHAEDFTCADGVHLRGRLVEHEQPGLHDQDRGQCDALLLSPG